MGQQSRNGRLLAGLDQGAGGGDSTVEPAPIEVRNERGQRPARIAQHIRAAARRGFAAIAIGRHGVFRQIYVPPIRRSRVSQDKPTCASVIRNELRRANPHKVFIARIGDFDSRV